MTQRPNSAVSLLSHAVLAVAVVGMLCYAAWSGLNHTPSVPEISAVDIQQWKTLPTAPRDTWEARTLPARLCKVSPQPCYDYYRVKFMPTEGPMAVYMPRFVGSVRVILNGEIIDNYGSVEDPVDVHFVPKLTRLPDFLLQQEQINHLDFVVTNLPSRFHLIMQMYVGPEHAVVQAFRVNDYLSNTLPILSIGVFSVLGLLSLVVFSLGGRGPIFGWFALITLFASMRAYYFVWTELETSYFRDFCYFMGSFGTLVAVLGFARRVVGDVSDRIDVYLLGLAGSFVVMVMLLMSSAPDFWSYIANQALRIVAIPLGLAVVYHLYRYFRRPYQVVKLWSFLLFVAGFLFVLHDAVYSLLGEFVPSQLSSLSPLFVVVAFCLIAGQQFSQALIKEQNYRRQLAQEVSTARTDIAQAYDELSALRERETALSERHRVMREVHDGIGGKLAGTLFIARRKGQEDIATQLEESLLDLRTLIDTLNGDEMQCLATALRSFEQRAIPWLQQHHIVAHFEVSGLEQGLKVPAQWLLNVLRIVQEGVNNVIRHANATELQAHVRVKFDCICIDLTDDGVGFRSGQEGRGVANMRERCLELGGRFSLKGSGKGTILWAELPFPEGMISR